MISYLILYAHCPSHFPLEYHSESVLHQWWDHGLLWCWYWKTVKIDFAVVILVPTYQQYLKMIMLDLYKILECFYNIAAILSFADSLVSIEMYYSGYSDCFNSWKALILGWISILFLYKLQGSELWGYAIMTSGK